MKGLKETATAHIIVLKLEKYSSRKENISMLEQFGAKTQIYIYHFFFLQYIKNERVYSFFPLEKKKSRGKIIKLR